MLLAFKASLTVCSLTFEANENCGIEPVSLTSFKASVMSTAPVEPHYTRGDLECESELG